MRLPKARGERAFLFFAVRRCSKRRHTLPGRSNQTAPITGKGRFDQGRHTREFDRARIVLDQAGAAHGLLGDRRKLRALDAEIGDGFLDADRGEQFLDRIDRGVYGLTSAGAEALKRWPVDA